MDKRFINALIALSGLLQASSVLAENFGTSIPMQNKGANTFYVPAEVEGLDAVDFMVDTGSGHATINEETLAILVQQQNARYVKNIRGYTGRWQPYGGSCLFHQADEHW